MNTSDVAQTGTCELKLPVLLSWKQLCSDFKIHPYTALFVLTRTDFRRRSASSICLHRIGCGHAETNNIRDMWALGICVLYIGILNV